MVQDKHLIFLTPDEGEKTETRAVCLTQNDLPAPTDGIGPYEGLWLNVTPIDDVSNMTVTLQHCDTKDGTFDDLVVYPGKSVEAGERLIAAPVPHNCKNWLKVIFGAAFTGNAFLSIGVDKFE